MTRWHCLEISWRPRSIVYEGRQSFGLYAGRARQYLQQLTTTRVGAPSTSSVSANLSAQCRGSTTCRHARHSPVRLLTTNDQLPNRAVWMITMWAATSITRPIRLLAGQARLSRAWAPRSASLARQFSSTRCMFFLLARRTRVHNTPLGTRYTGNGTVSGEIND